MNDINKKPEEKIAEPQKKPNEQLGFHVSGSVTIKDPESGKIIRQLRCS
jgi:hypothetical protein